MLNIVVNAAHAIADVVGDGGKGKGKITVRTRPDGEWAVVEISDTGAGMPPHIQQRIFDPFFTTKEVGKGTGQGLAIAHNVIVDKHGGTIKVASAPGAGTTFTIRLPIGGAKAEPEPRRGRSLNAIRVIFVDDEPRVLEGLQRMLRPKRNEWDMTFVGSAQAALDALKAEPCEVVVTDMRMPGMNGAELLEVVQREYPDTIRLILSGQAETESVMKALGVSHQFLSKPCDAEILQGTICARFRAARPGRQRGREGAGRAHQQTTDAACDLSETRRDAAPAEFEHRGRLEHHRQRSGHDGAPAETGELGVLRLAEAGRRRGARRSAVGSIASWRWCSARASFPIANRQGRGLQHGRVVGVTA